MSKQIFQTALTDVRVNPTTLPEALGTIRQGSGNKVYKYVQFSGTTVIAAGDVVCYVVAASDGNEVIVNAANTVFGAGVALAALAAGTIAAGAVAYATGWIQIRGLATLSTALAGAPSAGDMLTTSGATLPAVTLVNAVTKQACCQAYDVAGKKVICNFPY